ncbi:LysR substrate-binding domain-containing protein [Rhodoferax sp. GW822-FHT02A01]|uniref:LysR substrate-binding domain-containing protein n=1 Tax=Rhodoferax sp. GW822-FHT02A01 TaxID=3141537 RepID=UPI00315DCB8D
MTDTKTNQSLNNLLVFESAARRGSFTRAAEDLGISQPAVSHAMRLLEADLGVALFERQHKGVQTTEAGKYLLEQVGMGLSLIDQALREVRGMQAHQVTLAVSTATATWWLLPRIARFKQMHPDIELRVITTDTDLDLARERIDLAVTLGADDFAHYQRWHFVDEEIFPVCSPKFLKENPLPDLKALAHSPLLLLEERYRPRMAWKDWLARFGISLPRQPRLFRFNDYSIVLQAAIEGQGVAQGWRHIVQPLIAQGLLVRPIDASVTTDQPLYITAPQGKALRTDVAYLKDWLVAEASTS